ncbi:MAG: hypothetical protein KDD69_09210 [Bdellovibrionales bacterium]|nr:hypothetical protein [Bdellovibrionales bacterium]
MFSWWSCEKFTERVSKALDGTLPWYERPSYYFRLLMCSTSRRFRRQLYKMERLSQNYGCRCLAGLDNEETSPTPDQPKLTPEATHRIQAAVLAACKEKR